MKFEVGEKVKIIPSENIQIGDNELVINKEYLGIIEEIEPSCQIPYKVNFYGQLINFYEKEIKKINKYKYYVRKYKKEV